MNVLQGVICGTLYNKPTLGRAQPRQEPHKPKSRSAKALFQGFQGRAVARGASPTQLRVSSAAAGFPHSQDTTSLCSSLWIPLNCCYHCAASPEWAKPRNCLLEKPNTAREGEKKTLKKKNKSHTGHSYHYEKSNELLYIHIANNFTSWEMRLLISCSPGGGGCWFAGSWLVQHHTESMLSVVVGVLNKIDGVGAS